MLEAAVDISRYPNPRDEYLSILVGEKKNIEPTLKRLNYAAKIHMSKISDEKTKNDILDGLDFRDRKILSLCVRTERTTTVKILQKKQKNNYAVKRIWNSFDYKLFRCLEPELSKYLIPRKCALSDITFQCDKDCRGIIKTKGLRYVNPGDMYELADICAWGNSHDHPPKGVIELDYSEEIREYLAKKYVK